MITKRFRPRAHFGRLLTLLILGLIFSGFHDTTFARVINALIGLLVAVVAVTATGLRDRIRNWQYALVGAFALTSVIIGISQRKIPQGISAITGALALAVIMIAAMEEVLSHEEVELQTLFGAMCVYLLLGQFFARVYTGLDLVAWSPVFNQHGSLDATYFSFTTLTTVGYGDILAIGPFARRIALVEGISGQVFLATTVARLVSLYRGARSPAEASGPTAE